MFKHDCKINGHRYEPRFSYVMPITISYLQAHPDDFHKFQNKIYEHDICVKCGDVIHKKKEN